MPPAPSFAPVMRARREPGVRSARYFLKRRNLLTLLVATVGADQLQQVGGATDLMIAVGNVEITRGQIRLLADRVEINRDTGQAVSHGKVVFYDGPDARPATGSTTT